MHKFNKKKAKEIFNLRDIVLWIKTGAFALRLFIVLGIIAGIIFGVGYYTAMKNRKILPQDISTGLKEGKTYHFKINGDWLEVSGQGYKILDKDKKLKKTLIMKDCPELLAGYKPIALHDPKLIGVYGLGWGSKAQIEYGAGIEMLRTWKAEFGGVLTDKAGYLTCSYPIKKIWFIHLDNTDILGGSGYLYKGERQHIFGLSVKF